MNSEDRLIAEIKAMELEFQQVTGREAFGYISKPTPGTARIVFQDGTVHTDFTEARAYMASLLTIAQNDPSKLPYPLDQELTPEQDLRLRGASTRDRGDT